MGKTIISTQQEWEEVRPASGSDTAMRAFLREYGFDPDTRVEVANENVEEHLKPKAGSIRRQIFDQCFRSGWTIEQVNNKAEEMGGASVRKDADLFIGLFSGQVRLP